VHVHAEEHLPRPADGAAEGLTGVAGPKLSVIVELLRSGARNGCPGLILRARTGAQRVVAMAAHSPAIRCTHGQRRARDSRLFTRKIAPASACAEPQPHSTMHESALTATQDCRLSQGKGGSPASLDHRTIHAHVELC